MNQPEPTAEPLLALYTVTNNYIVQYRDLAFRAAVITIGMLGACIGLGLNDRFRALWSQQSRGVLLSILVIVVISAEVFICIINGKCVSLKRRRASLEKILALEIYAEGTKDTFVYNWGLAIAFCGLIMLTTFLALVAFSH
jgi:hypothetical protein